MASPFLRWPALISIRTIAIMSGILSLYRELSALMTGKTPTVSAFWICAWIAFIVSAFLAWLQEHQAISVERERREKVERSLKDLSPRLYLEFSPSAASNFLNYSGLIVRNSGKSAAFAVNLSCGLTAKFRLLFTGTPIQRIEPDKGEPIDLLTEYLNDNGLWYPVGGTRGGQIQHCFERLRDAGLEMAIPVTIKYTDYDGREFATPCVIRHEDLFLTTGRIWCELARAAS